MTYARAAQPRDGAMLPECAATRCFATVTQSHTNVIRYLCGDGENATCQAFPAPIREQPHPLSTRTRQDNRNKPYGCCGSPVSAPAGRACRITNQSLSFKEQRSCGAALMLPARDCAALQSLSP